MFRRFGFVLLLILVNIGDLQPVCARSRLVLNDVAMPRDDAAPTTQRFAEWTLVCNESARPKRRVCRMRTTSQDDRGTPITIDISLDGDQPTVLLHLPTNIGVANGVVLHASAVGAIPQAYPIAVCGVAECRSTWPMTNAEIEALSSGQGIVATYRAASMDDLPVLAVRLHDLAAAQFRIPSRGFREAIAASMP